MVGRRVHRCAEDAALAIADGRPQVTLVVRLGAAYLPQRYVRWATFSLTEHGGYDNRPSFCAGAQSDPRSIAVWTNSFERRSRGWPQVQIRVLPKESQHELVIHWFW